jgi:hypothetical protein
MSERSLMCFVRKEERNFMHVGSVGKCQLYRCNECAGL